MLLFSFLLLLYSMLLKRESGRDKLLYVNLLDVNMLSSCVAS